MQIRSRTNLVGEVRPHLVGQQFEAAHVGVLGHVVVDEYPEVVDRQFIQQGFQFAVDGSRAAVDDETAVREGLESRRWVKQTFAWRRDCGVEAERHEEVVPDEAAEFLDFVIGIDATAVLARDFSRRPLDIGGRDLPMLAFEAEGVVVPRRLQDLEWCSLKPAP